MAKKFSLVLAAVAVLAFAIPAMASASKATLPAGTLAPVGTKFTMTGSDFTLKSTLLGNITCETLNLNGEITKNNGEVVEGSGNNVSPTQTGCKNGEKTVIVTEFTITNLRFTSPGTATLSFIMKAHIGGMLCTFTGTNVPGHYTTGTNRFTYTAVMGVTGSPISCGIAFITAEWTFESGSTPIIIH